MGRTDNATLYHGVSVKAGQVYTLSFRAKASRSLWIRERVSARAYPSTTFSDFAPLNLGTSWKRYEMSFVSKRTYDNAVLAFGVGEKPATIWFDDVKLQVGARLNAYSRQFENGMVVVNANPYPVTMSLGKTYKKIAGDEDPVNNGAFVSSVTLSDHDGLVLLRTSPLSITQTRTISYGTTSTVGGTLHSTSGAGLVGREVVLHSSVDNETWTRVASVTTTESGSYEFLVRPSRGTYYKTRFYGDVDNQQGLSVAARLNVRADVSTPAAPAVMDAGHSRTVSGYLSPAHSAGSSPVRVYGYRYVSGHLEELWVRNRQGVRLRSGNLKVLDVTAASEHGQVATQGVSR